MREYKVIDAAELIFAVPLLQAYKIEIGEELLSAGQTERLTEAVRQGLITFYGAFIDGILVGMCSLTVGFSTFNCRKTAVFEDFYVATAYRKTGVARELVDFACEQAKQQGVATVTVGCCDGDVGMYNSLGFDIPLGNLLCKSIATE